MSMNGIDISHWQDGIDLKKIPCDFVIMKATQGTKFVDNCCDKFYHVAKNLGKKLGVYHYFGGGDPIAEADHFVESIRGYIGEAILVLDWEKDDNIRFREGAAVAKPFLDRVYEKTGVKPLIYMSKSVCREYDWSSVVSGDYGLWMAQYANKNPTRYQTTPWTDSKGMGAFAGYAIHQYSSTGRLKGFNKNLDLDIAYMTVDAWDKYARQSKNTENAKSTIKIGSRGADVAYLQQCLTDKGYSVGAIDGIFGVKTLNSVKSFQIDNNLIVDGIVGVKTWAAIN